MGALQRSLVALVVVSAGVAAALPFQRPITNPPPIPAPGFRKPDVRWRDPNILLHIPDTQERSPAEPLAMPSEREVAKQRTVPTLRASRLTDAETRLPELPESFETIEPLSDPSFVPSDSQRVSPEASTEGLVPYEPTGWPDW